MAEKSSIKCHDPFRDESLGQQVFMSFKIGGEINASIERYSPLIANQHRESCYVMENQCVFSQKKKKHPKTQVTSMSANPDTLFWQLSIKHNTDVHYQRCTYGNCSIILFFTVLGAWRTDGKTNGRTVK